MVLWLSSRPAPSAPSLRYPVGVTSLQKQFERDGYVVIPEAICKQDCQRALKEVIESWSTSPPTRIKDPNFRRHSPMPLSAVVGDILTVTMEHIHPTLSEFLQEQQELVELSSITVFPGAACQPLHRDEANEGHFLASVFINLADTHAHSGALQLIPGSHRMTEGGAGEAIAIEVAQGSALVMNAKLLHGGGANQSSDQVRSVLYYTVGETGLYGPPYSILEEVANKRMNIDEFLPRPGLCRLGWNEHSRPQLSPDCRILLPLSAEGDQEELLLCRLDTIVYKMHLSGDDDAFLELLQCIECHPRELPLCDLAQRYDMDLQTLIQRCSHLAKEGWLRS